MTISQLTKKCTRCQKMFPKTQENFFWIWHSKKNKSYPDSRCKNCSRELGKEYRSKNVQKLKENHRKYDSSPKGIYKKLRHSERSWEVQMTQDQFVEWYESQKKECCYCGLKEDMLSKVSDSYNSKTRRLTIDRMVSKEHYSIGNIALCCLRCNHIKGNFFTQSEMEQIGSKFIRPKWKLHAKKTV